MAKVGPKKKYIVTPEMISEVKKLSFNGATQEELMDYFGWKKDVWYRRCKEHPELAEACIQQKAKANIFVRGKLLQLCESGNPAAIFFYHKVHLGAMETTKIVTEQKIPDLKGKDPLEAAKIYQQYMTQSHKEEN